LFTKHTPEKRKEYVVAIIKPEKTSIDTILKTEINRKTKKSLIRAQIQQNTCLYKKKKQIYTIVLKLNRKTQQRLKPL